MNLDLPDPGEEPPGWFADIERIAHFLGELNLRLGRDFVIGIGDNERSYCEDLFFIYSPAPDINNLQRAIGVGEENA